MSDPQVERIGDAQLTSINITAATPDVLNRVCTEICDKVMEQIPVEAIEKIAQKVLEDGKIVYAIKTGPTYSPRMEDVEIELANLARKELGERMRKIVTELLDEWWTKPEVGELVKEAALQAFTQALADLPKILTANFCEKILTAVNSNHGQVVQDLVDHAVYTGSRLEDVCHSLREQTNLALNLDSDGRGTWYLGRPPDSGVAGDKSKS